MLRIPTERSDAAELILLPWERNPIEDEYYAARRDAQERLEETLMATAILILLSVASLPFILG